MIKTKISSPKPISNHLNEYFEQEQGQVNSEKVINSKLLFEGENDIDLKTELNDKEISYASVLIFNDDILVKAGLNKQYEDYLNSLYRLKVSRERKSRGEFVDMNKGQSKEGDVLDTMSKISNITGVKK